MPHALANVVGAGTGTNLGCIASYNVIPLVVLKVPHSLGKQTSSHKIKEACGDDQADLKGGCSSSPAAMSVTDIRAILGFVTYL